jgi:D-3-phosphoglycerate dehydrogenase
MHRILISDKLGADGLAILDQYDDVSYDHRPGLSPEELIAAIPEYDALIVRSGSKVTADVLAAGRKLKVVGRAGMGVDNIDVQAATQRGIVVMNTPGANSVATAELALGLMLAASRNIAQAHGSLGAGEWRRSEFSGQQLLGKTLGIIGFGRIGRLVAQRAKAFGMTILAYDPYVSEEVGREQGALLVELEDLLRQSDYITLHTAFSPESAKMINAESIALMKDGAIIINDARGKLVDEEALAAALQSGKLKAAGIDVYSSEPPALDNPLLGLPNVTHTPHLGASTVEASREVGTQIARQVVSVLRGEDFANAVNMPYDVPDSFAKIQPYMELAEKLGRLQAGLADHKIERLEIEVQGEMISKLVRAVAAGLLKGVLSADPELEGTAINYINAPAIAAERGLTTTQAIGINGLDYPNLVACRAKWKGGHRLLAGVLFGGVEPRIVQVDQYRLEARPEGTVLIMQNRDVPGVIGSVGTLLSEYGVNIGEWRLGRDRPGGDAMSFINLDGNPPEAALQALAEIDAVTQVRVVHL